MALSFGARTSSCSSDILLQVSVAVQTVSEAIFPATAVGASKYFASLLFRWTFLRDQLDGREVF